MKTEIISAFCGTGKSYLCNNFPNDYKEVECWEYRTGDFPNNYIKDVISLIDNTKYIFISTDPVILRALNELNIKFHLVYPDNTLRNEYLDRYIERDNPYDFIGTIMKNWNIWINELKDIKFCNHTVLKSGEYLNDIIKKDNNAT